MDAGFIIGYVGGTHIPTNKKESHAHMLMSGEEVLVMSFISSS